jgi:hypothetical protein
MEGSNVVQSFRQGDVRAETSVHCLRHENKFGVDSLFLMGFAEFLEDFMSRGKGTSVIIVPLRDMAKEEGLERTIV